MIYRKTLTNRLRSPLAVAVAATIAGTAVSATAQEQPSRRASAALLEEVVVTARKREEGAQDVPISVSAFNSDQLDALKVRNLTNLAVSMPSVVLDEIGTSRGYANFSVRGLGVSSSIASIDPAVGIVVDGVYLGTSSGVVFDNFDLASIEVLRGPQGTLFGRNVTGGAVLLNTRAPEDEFRFTARTSYEAPIDEGAGSFIAQGTITGALTDTLSAKLAVYYNDDQGALVNQFDGSDHGAYEQTIIRPSIAWRPTDTFEMIVRYENQDVEADGPSGQSHTNGRGEPGTPVNFDRDSFDFSINNPGSLEQEVDFLNITANWDVLGGTITNVFGWRESETITDADIDAQPVSVFHSDTESTYDQISNELRYNGLFADDRLNLTVGLFWFESELRYEEDRDFAINPVALGLPAGTPLPFPSLVRDGGGEVDNESIGIFISGDFDVTDRLTLSAGLRYTEEEKEGRVVNQLFNQGVPAPISTYERCYIVKAPSGRGRCTFDFEDTESWEFISPRLGAQYELTDQSRVYASWTIGYRSGGFNVRNSEAPLPDGTYLVGPGPFDQEEANNFEVGYKSEWSGGQLNLSAYFNDVGDLQRELNFSDPGGGVAQVITNVGDAELWGVEAEGTFAITDSFTLKASLGYLDASYTAVRADLDNDGDIDDVDKGYDLTRAPELTYSIAGIYDIDLGSAGYISTLVSFGYRDETAYTEDNLGYIDEQEQLDFSIDWHSLDERWVLSFYGRNLLDTVRHGGDTQLGVIAGTPVFGTFAPLSRPATLGLELNYSM